MVGPECREGCTAHAHLQEAQHQVRDVQGVGDTSVSDAVGRSNGEEELHCAPYAEKDEYDRDGQQSELHTDHSRLEHSVLHLSPRLQGEGQQGETGDSSD